MRPLDEWDATDLQSLISEAVQESLTLDYKQSESLGKADKKKADIAKDVSAFANSAGGRLVFGICEQNRLPVSIDGGSDPNDISREWLEQVINSLVKPRISGIVIKPINLASNKCAYVVDVPQARSLAPHQASEIDIISDITLCRYRWRTTRFVTLCDEAQSESHSFNLEFCRQKG